MRSKYESMEPRQRSIRGYCALKLVRNGKEMQVVIDKVRTFFSQLMIHVVWGVINTRTLLSIRGGLCVWRTLELLLLLSQVHTLLTIWHVVKLDVRILIAKNSNPVYSQAGRCKKISIVLLLCALKKKLLTKFKYERGDGKFYAPLLPGTKLLYYTTWSNKRQGSKLSSFNIVCEI